MDITPQVGKSLCFKSSILPPLIREFAGFGKILHWESNDRGIWNFDSWENDWYTYQNAERAWMNASTMPDKIKPEHHFRDYEFTTRLIDSMKKMHSLNQYFMAAIGFKLPHLAVHIPHKYYEMYKGETSRAMMLTEPAQSAGILRKYISTITNIAWL